MSSLRSGLGTVQSKCPFTPQCAINLSDPAREHAPDFEHVYSITEISALIKVP